MRIVTIFFAATICFAGCFSRRSTGNEAMPAAAPAPGDSSNNAPAAYADSTQPAGGQRKSSLLEGIPAKQVASPSGIDSVQSAAQAFDRKIIRNAELTIELDSPADAQRKIASIAEAHSGFVVTSEARTSRDGNQPRTNVNVIVRVPAAQFSAALEAIRRVGGTVQHEKIAGQDVTEEFIDLEARLRTQRALEAQFLQIMRQAGKIADALEVQRQIADVRTEIERIEGRRRFLENQSALSTINITLHTPAPIVTATTSGFWHNLKRTFGDSIDLATEIVLGVFQFVIVLIPILLLIVLPLWLLLRFLRSRISWPKRAEPAE